MIAVRQVGEQARGMEMALAARSPGCASGVRSVIDQYAEDGCEQRRTEHDVDRLKCVAVPHQTAPT